MIPITAKYIEEQFWIERKFKGMLTAERIEKVICSHFKVSIEQVMTGSRRYNITECRHLIWYYLRTTGMSLQLIAKSYNKKDHTSVIHAINKVERLLQNDDEMKYNISAINTQLNLMNNAKA
jgi:chromosomal replication initiator protein